MPRYIPNQIEPKWQEYWEKEKLYYADDSEKSKPKYYALVMFPYPSGDGLHVGHTRNYIAGDITARYKRMRGFNVLHPIGWDAFGLPAENAAIKKAVPPRINTDKNITNFKRQIKSIGISYNWDREIDTTDPNYYKWTQWIFLKLFKRGLAYEDQAPVNWCPSCKTGLANEEVVTGACERCGTTVEKKYLKQWILKITEYADRLLTDLKELDWPKKIKLMQENWIGKKQGINITYRVEKTSEKIVCFTTRPDTNFGATFIVLGPEHPLVLKITKNEYSNEIKKYIEKSKNKSEQERIAEGRKKTGIFTGSYATNNLNNKKMPIWVSDFVLGNVGTGAVVGVPGHDKRDFEFAKEFSLPIIRVVVGKNNDKSEITKVEQVQEEEGTMINSEFLDGMDIHKATTEIIDYMEEKGWGKKITAYHLRDWIFSRQRYWGEPIPIVHCQKCGAIAVLEKDLPIKLPEVEKYQPTGTGESPLALVSEFVNTICPNCGGPAKRETNTMPQWAGSCWYFLRYTDPKNNEKIFEKEKAEYWMPVDIYTGGAEHAVLHLLYARFWNKVLYDEKIISFKEPFLKLRNQGMVLGEGGIKMSKSKGNVVNPDDIVNRYGADTLRIYEMFMGPFKDAISWDPKSIEGSYRFLHRVWHFINQAKIGDNESKELQHRLHKLIKKITEDIEVMKFNTMVSAFMEFINFAIKENSIGKNTLRTFLILFAPLAPHISEELWHYLEPETKSIHLQKWPEYDENLAKDETIKLVIQINGKTRDSFTVLADTQKDEIKQLTIERKKVKKYIEGKEIKRVIFIKGRLINIVL